MEKFREILYKYWGYKEFRPLQDEIIHSVSSGKDTLGLMPTGGGKSITFQVPALAQEGICLVITPLIALMKDQVENLQNKKIKALAIYSGMTRDEIDVALENAIYGNFKFLYISPERIASELFQIRVQKMNVNLIAVDESHCISQWGYDFRPSYLEIAVLRKLLPGVPFLALTATATPEVVDDIQDKLGFTTKNVLRKSFERKNLVYVVRETEDKLRELLKIAGRVKGTGIVYVRNRKKTKEIALFLKKNGMSADYYHAGLSNIVRNQKQDDWKKGGTKIIVSTNAFGMGIDKPDVRFVVHMDLPDTLEAYFQEAGRAGRDEKKAYAVLLFNNTDKVSIDRRIAASFPDIKEIKKVYQALGNFLQIPIGSGKGIAYDFNMGSFAAAYKLNILTTFSSLRVLQKEGYIEFTEEVHNPSVLHFKMNRDDLYKFQVENEGFDGFIKLVLRLYSGLFSDFVAINEQQLAKKAGIHIEQVYKYLKHLNQYGVVKYIPQRQTPYIVFTEERLDDKTLYISHENYKFRKDRYVDRIQTVLDYATENKKCRSQQLLAYFGEKESYPCGQCDVCISKNELDMSRYEFNLMMNDIMHQTVVNPVSLDGLVDNLSKRYQEDKLIKVIQWLLDNSDLVYNSERNLSWQGKVPKK